MEGPQFSTRAESNLYRSWGCEVIGMTNMPEAKLAREAEICYATVAMVTDYDCWHAEHAEVDVAAVIKVLHENVDKAHALIERLARDFPREHPPCPIGSDRALDVAIITPPDARDPALAGQARCRGRARPRAEAAEPRGPGRWEPAAWDPQPAWGFSTRCGGGREFRQLFGVAARADAPAHHRNWDSARRQALFRTFGAKRALE